MQSQKKYNSLDEIFNDEDFHLIEEKKKVSNTRTPDERLLSSFIEINDFVEKNERLPEANISNIMEFKLHSRLKALREDMDKVELLKSEDKYDLLPDVLGQVAEPTAPYREEEKEINSIDDLLDDDLLADLTDDDMGLFDFKHTPREDQRAKAEMIGQRKPCKDFDKYEDTLKGVQNDLASGKRKLIPFKVGTLREGEFYVHNGILFFLEKVDMTREDHYKEDGTRVRSDGRTRCIFENGTESNILLRSVEKNLYGNGFAVSQNMDEVNKGFQEQFGQIEEDDKTTGYIYVLRSKSNDPRISSINDLYKIGFSTNDVKDRIKNAENEPTYLMAPVDYVSGWECYNMNTHKFEQLIHQFFGSTCLDIEVTDSKGINHLPREWFIVPLNIIEQAIELIINGKVVDYRYDVEAKLIVKK